MLLLHTRMPILLGTTPDERNVFGVKQRAVLLQRSLKRQKGFPHNLLLIGGPGRMGGGIFFELLDADESNWGGS